MTAFAFAKNEAKNLIEIALASRSLRAALVPALRGSAKIVFGHYIGNKRPYVVDDGVMSLDDLKRRLEILGQHFNFVALDRIIADSQHATAAQPDSFAITIDDGFDLLREGAIDVFEAYKVPITTFVIVDCIDNQALAWPNKLRAIEVEKGATIYRTKLAALNERHGLAVVSADHQPLRVAMLGWPAASKDALADELWQACDMPPLAEYLERHRPYYTMTQLRELIRRGHGVGLHSRTHPFCDSLTDSEVDDEFCRPAQLLREQLGLASVPMAYPFGVRLTSGQEAALRGKAVVSSALGTRGFSRRPVDPFALERACFEGGIAVNVFCAPLIRQLRHRFRSVVAR